MHKLMYCLERGTQIYSNAICPTFSALSGLCRKKAEISISTHEPAYIPSLYPCLGCKLQHSSAVLFKSWLNLETRARTQSTNNASNLMGPIRMLTKQWNIKGPWNPVLQLMSCCFHSLQASCRAFYFCVKSTANIRRARSTPWSQFLSLLPPTVLLLKNKV